MRLLCPQCASPNVEYASMMASAGGFVGLGLPEKYMCKDCGYVGSVVVETDAKGGSEYRNYVLRRKRLPEKHMRNVSRHSVVRPVFMAVAVAFLIASIFLIPSFSGFGGGSTVVDAGKNMLIVIGSEQRPVNGLTETTEGFDVDGGKVYVRVSPMGDKAVVRISAFDINEAVGVKITDESGDVLAVRTVEPPSMVERSTGIGTVTGFFVPLLMMVMALGFVMIMIHSQWHRMRAFL